VSRVLITGGAGFIGSHLAEAIIARGDSVTVVDDESTGSSKNLAAVQRHLYRRRSNRHSGYDEPGRHSWSCSGLHYSWCHHNESASFIVAGALIVVITVGSAGLLLSTPHYGNQLQARLDYIWKDATGGGRLVLWHDVVLRLLPNVWLRGTGLGMFRPAFAAYRSDNYSAFNPDVHFETAHNIFLDRWTEQGLPGLVILVVLIAITIQNNRKSFRHTSEASQRWAITAVTCALVSACIGNLFNGEVIPTAYYLYLWIGLSFATRDCFVPFVVPQYASCSFRLPAYAISAVLPCVLVWHANNNWIAEKNLSAALKALHAGNETDLVRFGRASVAAFPEKGVYGLEFSNLVLEFVNTHPLRDPPAERAVPHDGGGRPSA